MRLDVSHGTNRLVQRTATASGTYFAERAGVTVTVTAPRLAEVRHILATVRVAADPDGCSPTAVAVANPPARRLVPGHPHTLVRCVYATAGWLQASMRVSSIGSVADHVDALPAGAGTTGNGPWEHDQLRFGYAGGGVRTLDVRVGTPSVFSDGSRTGDDSGNHVMDLIARLSH